MAWELLDRESIKRYLEQRADNEPELARLMKLALLKPLSAREENNKVIAQLPDDAPEWARKKFAAGVELRRFQPDSELDSKVDHICDWIRAAIANNADWLKNLDVAQDNKPNRFKKIASLEQATALADHDMKLANKARAEALKLVPIGEGEVEAMVLKDGYRIVQLTTPTALDRESSAMGHCIGDGAYDKKLQSNQYQYFSLRDKNNEPHATLEIRLADNKLIQCQGKENNTPIGKYLPYIAAFIEHQNLDIGVPANCCGVVRDGNGRIHSIFHLPENLKIDRYLNLEDTDITALPDGLHIGDDLILDGTNITSLPNGLQVGGCLSLRRTNLNSLPDGLQIDGSLDLQDTNITSLPSGLKVGKSLDLGGLKITSFPNDLRVGGDLYLHKTNITSLPDGLEVSGDLVLDGTNITSLPDNLRVGGDLYLQKTNITSLPKGLQVAGDLDIRNTNITSLPDDLRVGGDLYLQKTNITSLPKGLQVGCNLNLENTNIGALSQGLHVGGNLNLQGTNIPSLPDGLQVDRDLCLNNTNITSLPNELQVGGVLDIRDTGIRSIPEDAIIKGKILSKYGQINDQGSVKRELTRRSGAEHIGQSR